jgi:hypothetical protein
VLLLTLLSGCAALRTVPPPLGPARLDTVLRRLNDQRERVDTFYGLGTVTLKQWVVESEEARILVVGTRNPLRIKVEITHPWGAPVLHVLVDRGRLKAFSFPEATLYTGPATPDTLERFLPAPPALNDLWSLLRGYPPPPDIGCVPRSEKGPRLVCPEACPGAPWSLQVRPDTLEPERLTFLESRLEVSFDDIRVRDGIRWAGTVCYHPGDRPGKVVFRNERMVFNQEIPEAVYMLKTPPSFREVELEHAGKGFDRRGIEGP